MEANNNEDDGSSILEVLPRLSQPMPCNKTVSTKKKKKKEIFVIGDSLLKGAEFSICRLD